MIRNIYCLLLFLFSGLLLQAQEDAFFKKADVFFKTYVNNGRVNYAALKTNPAQLNELITLANSAYPAKLGTNTHKAFAINAYNLYVIELLVDKYPVKSPMDIAGFFDNMSISLGNKKMSLNELENDILRPTYKDARLHFVLVCGALGCPPITNFAYQAYELEEQLNAQSTLAVNNNSFIRIDDKNKKVALSQIFKWYETDFKLNGGNALQFINKYRKQPLPANYTTDYYDYNWQINSSDNKSKAENNEVQNLSESVLVSYSPSVLLKPNQIEFKLFNNLYTQTNYFEDNRKLKELGNRSSYFSSFFQFFYGINSRVNIGFDVVAKSVKIGATPQASATDIFSFGNDGSAQSAINQIGPKIKVQPFKSLPRLSLQSQLYFPTVKDQQGTESGRPFLDYDKKFWWNQLFYDKVIGSSFQFFSSLNTWYRFGGDKNTNVFQTPLNGFFSYFYNTKLTSYVMAEIAPTWSGGGVAAYYTQAGIGLKYQVFPALTLEALYTDFFAGKNAGAGQTFNLGLRLLR